jgi:hypothetical protein
MRCVRVTNHPMSAGNLTVVELLLDQASVP